MGGGRMGRQVRRLLPPLCLLLLGGGARAVRTGRDDGWVGATEGHALRGVTTEDNPHTDELKALLGATAAGLSELPYPWFIAEGSLLSQQRAGSFAPWASGGLARARVGDPPLPPAAPQRAHPCVLLLVPGRRRASRRQDPRWAQQLDGHGDAACGRRSPAPLAGDRMHRSG